MFSNNVDLKNNNRNYKKHSTFYICAICFKSVLINIDITYDTVM